MILREFQSHKTHSLRKFSSDCLNEEIQELKIKMSEQLLLCDSGDS